MPSRDPSPSSLDAPVPAPPPVFEHPSQIGPYRILRVLGEGGMGVVYLAEQTEPVHREVALKILKLGMDTRQVVARFESERQALAVMEHPGIAKVYDAGATGAGRPYFVMERVDGVPLTEYCDAHRLSVRERVRLFTQVCRAVQHAHQKGVIHRDLKPSNVLVTEGDDGPLCKVIDFGIAKATEQDAAERTRLTQVDQSVGTPAYMSPEQAASSGLDVDTRSDIYSLGVVLYELLAGTLPFEPQVYRGWGFLAHHLAMDPPTPSARLAGLPPEARARAAEERGTDAASLRKSLRGDPDWIVTKALEKERDRRYATAADLAEDLEHYLRHEPVLAGPPGRGYRTRKFVRRHRAGVAFAATLAVLLIGFASTMAVQNQRIARARAVAEVRQAQAEDLIGFMLGDLRGKLTPIGRLDVLDGVGERALAYFAAVPESELSDEELYRRSEALRQIGEVRFEQGDQDPAMDAFRRSLSLAQGLAARDPENPEWQLGLAFSHYWIGFLHYYGGRDFGAALRHFEPYLHVAERLVAREPDNSVYRLELSYAHSNIGSVLEAQGNLPGALRQFQASLAAKREAVRQQPQNLDWKIDLANTYNTIGVVQRKLGDLEAALENHRAELALKQELTARDPGNMRWRRFLALGHTFMAGILEARGETSEALEHRRAARDTDASLVARDPTNTEWERGLARSEKALGLALLAHGDVSDALERIHASRAPIAALLARDPENTGLQRNLAEIEHALAVALLAAGRPTEALSAGRRAVELAGAALERKPADQELRRVRSEGYLGLGSTLARTGRHDEAREAWTRALEEIEPIARASGNTDHLALWASGLLHLDGLDGAEPVIAELVQRGYREREFMSLARAKGAVRP